MNINLPNQITLSRLILAIIFFALLSSYNVRQPSPKMMYWTLALFVVASLTDWLDGYLARTRNQITSLGRILDPFVDKVLVCGAFILFLGPGFVDHQHRNITHLTPWMVVIILGRELLVSTLRSVAEAKSQAFGADWLGKIKTVVQLLTVGWIILLVATDRFSQSDHWMPWMNLILIWTALALTILSGLNYLWKARSVLVDQPS